MRHVLVIGGGILGLATAHELAARGDRVTVLEKEDGWARHQTGHNSNVVHAGLYYAPGSFKARMSVAGNKSIVDFALANGVPVAVCGKLVVATSDAEVPALRVLAERAAANGVPARLVTPEEAREWEPEVACVAALRVETTGIIDFPAVCAALVRLLTDQGADLRLNTPALGIRTRGGRVEVATGSEVLRADALVNCAGLHSDRVARMAGLAPKARIVPFRGEYYELRPRAAHLVRGLIYPVPDATLPFLGVHLTRMLDGSVHAGPNAVLALRREGYRWADVSAADLLDTVRFPGTWRLARRYAYPVGLDEVRRSLSRRRFAASLAKLVPAVTEADIVASGSGVRAQALLPDGTLVQDFLIESAPGQVHVLNAPSPAATCALEIGRHIASLV
ncbi:MULTISPECIES: L-2-hydroxyglutarate oxidase [Actinokineospora]|uniref:Hydroxyglutarate oxidase n=1 Tax=Actinokineospora fastidiosa TaxID=1816 RepID=A0A918G5B3_9PSEU|nr:MULTISPECIES: L-2-hydroxyglutarate oxidase [Actinokineospora]UVS76461.1 L-2-hydroxyglutarate oxidase LhgO [Actinokineospora sp. UTMC 2448]GGS17984.1 hydroxyglutarate oxidase [Actinokineospora fastidiosa]